MAKLWNDLDHRLSIIERWSTMHHLHRQSVAEHVFNVERMAIRIAKGWFGIHDPTQLWDIVKWAHHHDDFEALSGDFPGMVKPYFDESAFEHEHSDVVKPRLPETEEIRNIVKLADMLDCWWYLCVERALGNRYADNHFNFEPNRIVDFVRQTWPDNKHVMSKLMKTLRDMSKEVSIRHSRRGR